MDDSQGSSAPPNDSPPPSPTTPSTHESIARLENLHVTVPCKSASDALLAAFSVDLSRDLNSNVLDAILTLVRDEKFNARDVTFGTAQDVAKHISEQRKRIAQKRALTSPHSLPSGSNQNDARMDGGIPPLIIDFVAQQLAREMIPLAEQVDWDTNMYNVADAKCPREQDLLNMALVHRTWTQPVSRVLRTRAKLFGAKTLQSFLRSPRMGSWLREVYFVESLDNENAREMVRLLKHLLRNAPNLRKLAIRTWWRLDVRDMYDFHQVILELEHMQHLESLWLFPNRGHVACLPTLCSVLPNLRSLKALYIRNWMGGPSEDEMGNTAELHNVLQSTSACSNLQTFTFVDGGLNDTTAHFVPWLLRDSSITNLEIHTKDICRLQDGNLSPLFRALKPFLSKLKALRMHYSSLNEDKQCRTEFLTGCTNLKTLSITVGLHHALNPLPNSVENLHVHFSTIWPVNGKQLHDVLYEQQESLKSLKKIMLTKDPSDMLAGFQAAEDDEMRMENAWHIDDVKGYCEKTGIELTYEYKFVSFEELTGM
ncbi:uncharacterized protein FOMMEDRAFT_157656 [Fomitiporia mediterranea MF3/22]|uniref:uncharacterized protein n=1 Tax=Fomitiporia mediterranea (strain MF3/22) TaxID=694068 RepID=UPI0004407CEF|nr:uncharacterized protein FOMMEDRAFT_157656 [Fomitiporia mediterranea MF3/22]EJD02443.1 hypothetical protein FOMMEDRAFT_157656 [Fomitiporia mediterranea MF3/22]